jgi:hypothetical protein
MNSNVSDILEGLHQNRLNEDDFDDMYEYIDDLTSKIIKKYPKMSKCNLRIYSDGYDEEVSIFIGGKTNITGCEYPSLKKLMKEKDPVQACVDSLKKEVDKMMKKVGTNSYADKSLPLWNKFYDAIGVKVDKADVPQKREVKVRINDYESFKKYVKKTYGAIVDDLGEGFIIEYKKGAKSFKTDLKKKLTDMGYKVQDYNKSTIDIEVSKKSKLSVEISDADDYDNGVYIAAYLVY